MTATPSFLRLGPECPTSPIVLSVPHAGRDYPSALVSALRIPPIALRPLEDRHIDAVALAARQDETMLVAQRARAWIDLNRGEHERDPRIDEGAPMGGQPQSAKLRSGLGLIPRRAGASGEIWHRRLTDDEVMARITEDHRPYHAALSEALTAAHRRFGIAVLLDLHSMPPLGPPETSPRIVLGDRFGKSAMSRLVSRLEGVVRAHGIAVAINAPYAGGHILQRHADPRRGIHAIQVEFDRSLYLDARLDQPGAGLSTIIGVVRDMIDALADEALPGQLAAE
ncbi:N-formylglutamate amidohydrolase [Sphingomonas rustica]|uniref:N-formylglutamate amidohydrolase n=1 Tax=Sphingomonas rustica TaxID=3103142 RepID=UPI0031FC4009